MNVCSACVSNVYLKSRIQSYGAPGTCTICDLEKVDTFTIERLAEILSETVQRYFFIYDEKTPDDSDFEGPAAFDLEEVIILMLAQDFDFREELISKIVESDLESFRDGGMPFFDPSNLYAPKPETFNASDLTPEWTSVVDELKHRQRFFSVSVKNFFNRIFSDVDNMVALRGRPIKFVKVVREEPAGFVVSRARVVTRAEVPLCEKEPFEQVGPVPKEHARESRMSPAGVVALYTARDRDTAVAETRPAIGDITVSIEMKFTRTVRLLDYKLMESAMTPGWDAFLDYNFEKNLTARNFLVKLHSLISKPVTVGNESEYLITQVMSEYLAHVFVPRFDGIVFESSQCAGGANFVLFSHNLDSNHADFPVEYVSGSLQFSQIKRVNYQSIPMLRTNQSTIFE